MWRNDTLMMLVEIGSRVVLASVIMTGVGALVLFGLRVWIDQQ